MPKHFNIAFRYIFIMLAIVLSWHHLSFIVFQAARVIHYHHVRSTDPIYKNKLRDTIRMDKKELEQITWIKDDEIRYKGKMFDVKKQLEQNEHVLLIGHYDSKDDMLIAATFSFFDDQPISGKRKSNSIKLLLFDAVLRMSEDAVQPASTFSVVSNTAHRASLYEVIYIRDTSPPPEFLCV